MLELFFRKRRGLFLLVAVGIAAGITLVLQLPIKLYPNTMKPIIGIRISHPGYTAADFRDQYGTTLDGALAGIQDTDSIQSNYQNSNSTIRIDFKWDVDYDEARNRVESAMATIKGSLPEDSRDYRVHNWTGENSGFLAVAVTSEELDSEALYTLLDSTLKPHLDKVEDAEEISIFKVRELVSRVELEEDALLSHNLMVDDVIRNVRSGYRTEPVGSFRNGRERFDVRLKKGIDTIFDIQNIEVGRIGGNTGGNAVGSAGGRTLRLEDVADVTVKYDLPDTLFRMNGTQSVMIFATPKSDGNIKEMSDEVRRIIESVRADLPAHVEFTFQIDPAEFINNAIFNVLRAALIGAGLAVLCVLILLGEIKNTLLIAFSIPLSITLSFILMYLFNLTINLISLSGLTLSVGMIIDSTIVVMENIHRHRFHREGEYADASLSTLITASIKEIRWAVIASTLTSVLVFLPLSFTAPLTNAILGDLARAVVFALSCSVLVALLVVPVLAYYLFRRSYALGIDRVGKMARFSERLMSSLRRGYTAALRGILSSSLRSVLVLIVSFGLLVFAFLTLVPRIDREIIAKPESDIVVLFCRNFSSESKEEMLELIAPIEEQILESYDDQLKSLFAQVNRSNSAMFMISLASSRHALEVREDLEDRYQSDTDWYYQVMPWDPAELPLPRTLDLNLRITGPDKQQVLRYTEIASDLVRDLDLYRNVWTDPSTMEANEIVLTSRPDTGNIYPTSRLLSIARTLLVGSSAIEMNHQGQAVDVRISFPDDTITSSEDFANFLIPYRGGAIPMKHFFDISVDKNIQEIVTIDGEETFSVMAIMNREAKQAQREDFELQVKELLHEEMDLPPGYGIVFEDTQEELNRNVRSLIYAIAVSLVLIYIVLGVQFNSLRIPLVIMVAVPLGFIGVILSLYLFKSTISLNSMLGTILLGGIAVNNSIIMIDFYFQELRRQEDRLEALITTAGLRLAPILITMLTTVLGMLPIAMALGDGTNIIQPLGIAVSGGLAVSTIFTLFVVPTILYLFKVGKKKEKRYE
ncbi:MAG: efflux RND transporter permease subunit [Spirochaetota bacterium]|nr:efflux RND transporter permease subunit [Spirochaetota bacterium]